MKTLAIALAAVIAAGCSTKNHGSSLLITKVVAPTPPASGSTTCPGTLADVETDFIKIGPDNVGHVGLWIENHLKNDSTSPLALPTNDFQAKNAVVSYEIIGAGRLESSGQRPASGYVKAGSQASVGVFLFDSGQLATAGMADGTFFRASFHVEGQLQDGSTVSTSERDYLFQYCATSGCAANTCL